MISSKKLVVADIGGTNCRIALSENGELVQVKHYLCSDFSNINQPLHDFLSAFQEDRIYLCIAIACPIKEDQITMTNLNWSFSQKSLKEEFGFAALYIINDCESTALAIPFLSGTGKQQIGQDGAKHSDLTNSTLNTPINAPINAPIAICAPGTGLGIAHLVFGGNQWFAFPGEGGHVDFAPNDEFEQEILTILREKYGHVSMERLLSGVGLKELYKVICQIKGHIPDDLSPQQISEQATSKQCLLCHKALDQFCVILGSFAGNLALNLGTLGGVYIAGGIVPNFIDFLKASNFRQRFEAKGRYQQYNSDIPTYVVTDKYPGLKGAEIYLRKKMDTDIVAA